MKTLPLDQIRISPNRQRREFDLKLLNELGESITAYGLFHPIVVRYEGWPDRQTFLVSGERRLRAIKDIYELGGTFLHDSVSIPAGEVPVVSLGELDPIAREEAELDENIRRSDLNWRERAAATARLAALRNAQSERRGEPAPSVATIAEEVRGSSEGVHQEATRRELIVSKFLEDPEVKAAKGVDEAFKILKRREETQQRVQTAARVGQSYSVDEFHKALNLDSLGWMQGQPPEQFDVILTDPPYGIGADEFGDAGGRADGAHFYKDDYETWSWLIDVLAAESFRLTKPEAHLYIFCDITRFDELKQRLRESGWSPFRTPLIWHKPNGSRAPWPDQGPQRKHELICYAVKGKKKVTRLYGDVLTYSADENIGHPAQKPVGLFLDLLRRSCGAGDLVLDPFAGSGPLIPAAHEMKCRATLIEQDPAAYALCIQRLDQLKSQPELAGL